EWHEFLEQIQSCLSKQLHLGTFIRSTEHRCKGNEQNVQKLVLCIEITRIGNVGKCFEKSHRSLRINGKPLRIHRRNHCKSPRLLTCDSPAPCGGGQSRMVRTSTRAVSVAV